jgi:hypothetical protein
MSSIPSLPNRNLPTPKSKGANSKTDWKAFFKKTIVLVFLFSLAVHVLLLIGLGGVTLFKGRTVTLPFVTESVPADTAVPAPPPPDEEMVQEERTSDPNMPDETSATEDSAPPLEMMTLPGGASWAPAVPKDIKMSTTGSLGGSTAGAGSSTGAVKGMGRVAGVKLFGVEVKAKKLGVLADISGNMQPYIPKVIDEVFKNFPDADVIFMNGSGMEDWETALKNWTAKNDQRQKTAQENKTRFIGSKSMPKPQLVRFNSPEAQDSPTIRGTSAYGGFRKDYPDLYERLAKRSNTWMVTSYSDSHAAGVAFEQFVRRKVQAIYWFSNFEDPVVGSAAEEAAKLVLDNQMEVVIHSTRGVGKAADWIKQVNAAIVQTKLEK